MKGNSDNLKEKEIKQFEIVDKNELESISGGHIFDKIYKRYAGEYHVNFNKCINGCTKCYDDNLKKEFAVLLL